jgi:hypothetical protein
MLKMSIVDLLDRVGNEEFLKSLLPSMSDEIFLNTLISHRGRGRNDYPIDLLWKGAVASIVSKVPSIEEMRRKMGGWPELFSKVPSSFSFSRFFTFLGRFSLEIEALMFRRMDRLHSDFGRVLAIAKFDQIHFLWEPQFCLPLLFQIEQPNETPSAAAEQLLARLTLNPNFSGRCKYLLGNPSYDDLIKLVWDRFKIRAVIPIADSSKTLQPFHEAFYDERGMVYCQPDKEMRAMIYAGFEKNRKTLKYRCMARHYGTHCGRLESCPLRSGIRIPISLNERIFTPLPRTSYRWGQLFALYETLNPMLNLLRPFLQIANSEMKKVLCCRIVSLVLSSAYSDPQ